MYLMYLGLVSRLSIKFITHTNSDLLEVIKQVLLHEFLALLRLCFVGDIELGLDVMEFRGLLETAASSFFINLFIQTPQRRTQTMSH